MKLGLPWGISTGFWFFIGLIRSIVEPIQHAHRKPLKENKLHIKDIAVVLAAHNEEMVILDSINALRQVFIPKQIYIASDGSVDNTYMKAWAKGCNVLGIVPGVGKARALLSLIENYDLYNTYKFIFIIDADTRMDKDFIKYATPYLEDPKIGVVFATARIRWPQHIIPRLRYYYIAYRERLNRTLQFYLVYGQTWKYTPALFVIPGFATIYRSSVLKQLRIDTPGILIEDFNLAFQFHKKKLGAMGFDPRIIGWDQHPDNLSDYWKQVRRWNIGFFQTIRANGVWPSFFWLSVGVFTIEVFLHSIFVFCIPFLLLFYISTFLSQWMPVFAGYNMFYASTFGTINNLPFEELVIGYFWYDYAMTVVFAIMGRKPQFLFYGLFFFIMHFITSLILFSSIIPGFFSQSNGRWISPKRLVDF